MEAYIAFEDPDNHKRFPKFLTYKILLPVGDYHVRITSVIRSKCDTHGSPSFTIIFENQRGYFKKVFVINADNTYYLNNFFHALNIDLENKIDEVGSFLDDLLFRELIVVIVEEEGIHNEEKNLDILFFRSLPKKDIGVIGPNYLLESGYDYLPRLINQKLREDYIAGLSFREAKYFDSQVDLYVTSNDIFIDLDSDLIESIEDDYDDQDDFRMGYDEDYDREYAGDTDPEDFTVDHAFEGDPDNYWNVD